MKTHVLPTTVGLVNGHATKQKRSDVLRGFQHETNRLYGFFLWRAGFATHFLSLANLRRYTRPLANGSTGCRIFFCWKGTLHSMVPFGFLAIILETTPWVQKQEAQPISCKSACARSGCSFAARAAQLAPRRRPKIDSRDSPNPSPFGVLFWFYLFWFYFGVSPFLAGAPGMRE